MGSTIEGLIFGGEPQAAAVPENFKIVQLSSSLHMVPIPAAPLGTGSAPELIKGCSILRENVARIARTMSADRKVLYVYGETFGGPGIQEAAGWRLGQLFYGPVGTVGPVVGFLESEHASGIRTGQVDEVRTAGHGRIVSRQRGPRAIMASAYGSMNDQCCSTISLRNAIVPGRSLQ